jgi:hypothetical protein
LIMPSNERKKDGNETKREMKIEKEKYLKFWNMYRQNSWKNDYPMKKETQSKILMQWKTRVFNFEMNLQHHMCTCTTNCSAKIVICQFCFKNSSNVHFVPLKMSKNRNNFNNEKEF